MNDVREAVEVYRDLQSHFPNENEEQVREVLAVLHERLGGLPLETLLQVQREVGVVPLYDADGPGEAMSLLHDCLRRDLEASDARERAAAEAALRKIIAANAHADPDESQPGDEAWECLLELLRAAAERERR